MELFEALDGDPEVDAELSDASFVRAMLDAEAALVRALVEVDIAPAAAVDGFASARSRLSVDYADLGARAVASGNPAVPLVQDLRASAPVDAAPWIHYGATSQDIVDTALMLVAKRTLVPITRALEQAAARAAALATRHRDTLMIARTLGQYALPTTFGMKAAQWYAGIDRNAQSLHDLRADALAAQLGGAIGTLDAYGDQGFDVAARFASEVDLADPGVPWHTERSRFHRIASALGSATAAAGKVAADVIWMSQWDVGEVAEIGPPGHGASSAMPHKRNPSRAVLIMSAARRTPGLVGTLLGAGVHEHERAVGSWHAEWQTMRDLLHLSGGAAARVADLLANLDVDALMMRSRLDAFLADRSVVGALGEDALGFPEPTLRSAHAAIDRILARRRTDSAR